MFPVRLVGLLQTATFNMETVKFK